MAEIEAAKQPKQSGKGQHGTTIHLPFSATEPLAPTQPSAHYDMSRSRSFPIVIPVWLSENAGDPAVLVSVHCCPRQIWFWLAQHYPGLSS
jgi:hypothetical protein